MACWTEVLLRGASTRRKESVNFVVKLKLMKEKVFCHACERLYYSWLIQDIQQLSKSPSSLLLSFCPSICLLLDQSSCSGEKACRDTKILCRLLFGGLLSLEFGVEKTRNNFVFLSIKLYETNRMLVSLWDWSMRLACNKFCIISEAKWQVSEQKEALHLSLISIVCAGRPAEYTENPAVLFTSHQKYLPATCQQGLMTGYRL